MGSRDPLVLVHGYMDHTGTPWWERMERRLVDAGYDRGRIHQLDLGTGPLTAVGSPRSYGRRVRDVVERVADEHGDEVDLLAHSMGGLCARWSVEGLDADQYVDDLVTLGTPHQGSYLAYWGVATAGGRAMIPGSSFLRELNGAPLAPDVEYTAVWSPGDDAVRPADNATLPVSLFRSMHAARNVRVEGVGHMDLVSDPEVFDRYAEFLG